MVFALSGSVYAHGTDTGTTGSTGMMNMMDLMHEHMDENQAVDCDTVSDMEMMEHGEEMMEEVMGHEDHERMERSLNEEDHDSLHTMMGMWSSGCVGDETMNTLATRYGFSEQMGGPSASQGSTQVSWPSAFFGIIIGAVGFWVVGKFVNKKPVVSGTI